MIKQLTLLALVASAAAFVPSSSRCVFVVQLASIVIQGYWPPVAVANLLFMGVWVIARTNQPGTHGLALDACLVCLCFLRIVWTHR
jgi:hypothetical protein